MPQPPAWRCKGVAASPPRPVGPTLTALGPAREGGAPASSGRSPASSPPMPHPQSLPSSSTPPSVGVVYYLSTREYRPVRYRYHRPLTLRRHPPAFVKPGEERVESRSAAAARQRPNSLAQPRPTSKIRPASLLRPSRRSVPTTIAGSIARTSSCGLSTRPASGTSGQRWQPDRAVNTVSPPDRATTERALLG